MAAKHGTRHRYNDGCRCEDCKGAQAAYQRVYRERQRNGLVGVPNATPDLDGSPGPVELAVEAELAGLVSAEARPALAQIAICMGRLLDSPAATPKPQAAKVLVTALDMLRKGFAQGRRGSLAVVRAMSSSNQGT
jgi:hypothetical protein